MIALFNRFPSWEASVIRSSDLRLSETHAIEVLGTHGEMNMKKLAVRLGVTTGTITVTVDRLEKKGVCNTWDDKIRPSSVYNKINTYYH